MNIIADCVKVAVGTVVATAFTLVFLAGILGIAWMITNGFLNILYAIVVLVVLIPMLKDLGEFIIEKFLSD